MKLTILSAGAWGTALAIAFSARHDVTLWARETDLIQAMTVERENRLFLPGCRLPDKLHIEGDFGIAVNHATLLIVATPLVGLRDIFKCLVASGARKPLLWVCKGLEAYTAKLPHMIAAEELGSAAYYGVLSGPSFAAEVAQGLPTAVVLAAQPTGFAHEMALELHTPKLRIYANDDLPGVEVAGAVKNVLAIATGISDGLGLGANARAALMTRGLAEMARFGQALGGQRETLMGLAGMGDVVLTCTGDLSRNRQVGLALAAGATLPQILASLGHVAEGVSTAREVAHLADQMGIDMPITQSVNAILHHGLSAAIAVEHLLSRDPKQENI